MSANRTQSALLRQVAPSVHARTESTPDHVLSDQPHLVTSRPTEGSCSVSPEQTESRILYWARQDCLAVTIQADRLKAFSLQPEHLSR